MKRFLVVVLVSVAAMVGYAAPAYADLIYTLDVDLCTGGCGTAPFGTVLLHQGVNEVDVTVTLNSGEGFVSTSAGDALLFNLTGHPNISGSITFVTPGFSLDPTPYPGLIMADGSGDWQYGIVCDVPTGCGTGGSGPNPGPLVFDLIITGISVNDFIATGHPAPMPTGSHGLFFGADICGSFTPGAGCSANTGIVAASHPGVPVVPEPGSLFLLAAALLGLVGIGWKRGLSSLRKSA